MKRINYLSMGLVLILMGCAGDSKSNSDTKTEKITVPTQIDMDFPEALKSDKKAQKSYFSKVDEVNDDASVNKSRGYMQLKDSISNVEDTKKELKLNLLLAEKIMPQIQEKCQDIPLATTCSIEKDELSLRMDAELYGEISTIVGESLPADFDESDIPSETIKLGKTTFTKYADTEDFQYALVMDMSNFGNDEDTEIVGEIQTIKWSKDENKIWSIYDSRANDFTSVMSLRYVKKENGQTEMEIQDKYTYVMTTSFASSSSEESTELLDDDKIPSLEESTQNVSGEFYLKLTNLNEEYSITSSSKDTFDTELMSANSFGQIGKNGGYLTFRGVFSDTEYREKDTFDAKGGTLSSLYCDETQECNFEDESTWLQSENYEEVDFFNDGAEAMEIIELSVVGGELKENNQYILLAPNSTIENKTVEDIFSLSIGDILVDNRAGSIAILFDNVDLDKLDSLVVVEIEFPEYSENLDTEASIALYDKEPTFKVLDATSRPTLSKK